MKRILIKLAFLLLLLGKLSAQQGLLQTVIELEKETYLLEELFKELRNKHEIPISHGPLSKEGKIQFPSKEYLLKEILDLSLKSSSFNYQVQKGKVLVIPKNRKNESSSRKSINGFIKDKRTGEVLIGATVYDQLSGNGVISNYYGFFSLTVPSSQAHIKVSYLGFKEQIIELTSISDVPLEIDLAESVNRLEEVTITSSHIEALQKGPQMSTISLSSNEINSIPMVLGEKDILKAIQLLPGIQSGTEGTSGIYVRGGGPDQNLILLDEVPIYNSAHLFSVFSVFNSDAINKADVIKGGFPARYGGRLSSVIDISMKEGNKNKLSGIGSLGLISSKFLLEGPLKNEKTTFLITGRRSYFDLIDGKSDDTYYFHDFNAKINHTFSTKDRIYLSFYGGEDYFKQLGQLNVSLNGQPQQALTQTTSTLKWGNILSVFRWNHLFSPKLFANFSSSFSRYRFNVADERTTLDRSRLEALNYNSGVRDISVKAAFDYQPSSNYNIKIGTSIIKHDFNTGVVNLLSDDNLEAPESEQIPAIESSIYLENDIKIGPAIRFNLGGHFSQFDVRGRTYSSFQPRLSGRVELGNNFSIKASYSKMTQFLHLLTNSGIGLPTDLWVPATDEVLPQQANQSALGVFKSIGAFELSLETYYKEMDNLIEYRNGASYLATDTRWADKVEVGKGKSYGAEFLLRRRFGKLTGWFGYTWSKSTRQFENLNFGKQFPYKYDRRHDISVVGIYQWKENVTLAGTWVFGTGNSVTLPFDSYLNHTQRPITGGGNDLDDFIANFYTNKVENYAERNNYRMPNYHRLDLSIAWEKEKKLGVRTWSVGVYNVYARQNAFFVYIERDFNKGNSLKQASLAPFIPFVNYTFKF